MLNSRPSGTTVADTTNFDTSPRESGDDSEDESEILEESPCGRWLKRREEVDQRDVPGINCVHLAMDTEEGVEVVWNEVQYIDRNDLKSQEENMRQVFENLLQLDHPNIVKFHRYWTDSQSDKPRVIFITEYMSSGSLKQFLKRTKRNAKRLPLEAWRRWCTQILSALSYLHSCTPPVIHGNLTCDTIFIQHNGLVKIGSVVPDAIRYHGMIGKDNAETVHLKAPEFGRRASSSKKSPTELMLKPAIDIYAFGMCALEMAALEIQGTSDSSSINEETILRTINSLDYELQRDLIFKCLKRNPDERPSAHELLFHPLLFEVHSLKLLSAHCLVFSPKNRTLFSETIIDEMMQRCNQPEVTMARIATASGNEVCYRLADVPSADKLEKFVEDVKFGVYPLTAFSGKKPPHFRSRAVSPETADSVKSATPEPVDVESRRIVNMMCSVKAKEDSTDIAMTILLRMDDKMNRQLTCQVTEDDSASVLTSELVRLGFVHVDDQEKICSLLEDTLKGTFSNQQHQLQSQLLGQNQTLELSALNEPSSDSIKSDSANPSAGADRNWSVADTESPSNPHAAVGEYLFTSATATSSATTATLVSSSNSNSSSISNSSQHQQHESTTTNTTPNQQQHHPQQEQQQPLSRDFATSEGSTTISNKQIPTSIETDSSNHMNASDYNIDNQQEEQHDQ